MSIETEKGFTRRKFLKSSLGAAVAVACFTRAELREALAQAKATGKPFKPFTAAAVNEHIAFCATSPRRSRNFPAFVKQVQEFKRGPIDYLTKHFDVMPSQLESLMESFDPHTVKMLTDFLDWAVRERKPIKVIVVDRSERRSENASPLRSRVRYASFSTKQKSTWKVSFIPPYIENTKERD
jgi:hypothetical protein